MTFWLFILSIRKLIHKILLVIFFIAVILGAVIAIFNYSKQTNEAFSKAGKYYLAARTNEERVKFLEQFGWQVSAEPIEIENVPIPARFNAVYENYNNIQKLQGLDLSKYKQQSCTRYTYQILNYKNAPNSVRANILVLNNRVIGGDVCSVELDGFMHGFASRDNCN